MLTSRYKWDTSPIQVWSHARSWASRRWFAQVPCTSQHMVGPSSLPILRSMHASTLSHVPGSTTWSFRVNGERVQVDVKGPVVADSAHMLLRLAIEGVGIVRFGDIIAARAIQDGLLEPLLQDLQERENFPLWAILPPGRQRTPKVKVFLDFLMERFGSAPWRTQ